MHDLFVGQTFAQELIQQRLVSLSSSLAQLRTHLFYAICILSRNVLEFRSTTLGFPYQHLTLQHVDNGIEARTSVHRELYQCTLIAKVFFELIERTLEISVLVIALVDNKC